MEKSENKASLSSFHFHHKFELAYKKAKKPVYLLINSGLVLLTVNKPINYLMKSGSEVSNPLRHQYFVRVMKRLLHPPMRMLLRSLTRFVLRHPMKSAAVYLSLIAQILQLTKNLCISMKLQILKNGIINKLENKTLSGNDGIYNIMV